MKYYELDKEEEKILKNIESGKYKRVKNFELEKKKAIEIARNTLNKVRNINIRLAEKTLPNLKARAIEEGIPYQTLSASVLHKYVMKSSS